MTTATMTVAEYRDLISGLSDAFREDDEPPEVIWCETCRNSGFVWCLDC